MTTLKQEYTPNAEGYVNFRGQLASGKWCREETREVFGGTESRRTRLYDTEDELCAAEEAGLQWGPWR